MNILQLPILGESLELSNPDDLKNILPIRCTIITPNIHLSILLSSYFQSYHLLSFTSANLLYFEQYTHIQFNRNYLFSLHNANNSDKNIILPLLQKDHTHVNGPHPTQITDISSHYDLQMTDDIYYLYSAVNNRQIQKSCDAINTLLQNTYHHCQKRTFECFENNSDFMNTITLNEKRLEGEMDSLRAQQLVEQKKAGNYDDNEHTNRKIARSIAKKKLRQAAEAKEIEKLIRDASKRDCYGIVYHHELYPTHAVLSLKKAENTHKKDLFDANTDSIAILTPIEYSPLECATSVQNNDLFSITPPYSLFAPIKQFIGYITSCGRSNKSQQDELSELLHVSKPITKPLPIATIPPNFINTPQSQYFFINTEYNIMTVDNKSLGPLLPEILPQPSQTALNTEETQLTLAYDISTLEEHPIHVIIGDINDEQHWCGSPQSTSITSQLDRYIHLFQYIENGICNYKDYLKRKSVNSAQTIPENQNEIKDAQFQEFKYKLALSVQSYVRSLNKQLVIIIYNTNTENQVDYALNETYIAKRLKLFEQLFVKFGDILGISATFHIFPVKGGPIISKLHSIDSFENNPNLIGNYCEENRLFASFCLQTIRKHMMFYALEYFKARIEDVSATKNNEMIQDKKRD